jgi:hypothetical protein
VSGPLFEAFDAWVAEVRNAPQDQPAPRHVTMARYRQITAPSIDEAHYPDRTPR